MKLDREQAICIGAVFVLLLGCALAVQLSFQARADAAQELSDRREVLARFEARSRSEAGTRRAATAPAAAFLDAPTQGLAAAGLQAHLARLAGAERAVLISSGAEPAKREDPPDSIRLQATLEMSAKVLQTLLYQLESGTPYVFVESMMVQVPGTGAQGAAQDPLLRVTLSVRAVWRRGTA